MKITKDMSDGRIITVTAILQKIGGQKPYFSITAEIRNNYQMESCGCLHDEITKYFPEFADLIPLHLSDIDGVPMYAVENGWYWNGGTEYQKYDRNILAKHLRITPEQADLIHDNCNTKEGFANAVKMEIPRRNEEAKKLIEKYSLTISHS